MNVGNNCKISRWFPLIRSATSCNWFSAVTEKSFGIAIRLLGSLNCKFSVTFIKPLNQSSIKPCPQFLLLENRFHVWTEALTGKKLFRRKISRWLRKESTITQWYNINHVQKNVLLSTILEKKASLENGCEVLQNQRIVQRECLFLGFL